MQTIVKKSFLQQNLAFGTQSELKKLPFIKHIFGDDMERAKDIYSNFDYISDNRIVELKTRRGNYIKSLYSTFPFDAVKLEKYKSLKQANPNLDAYVCWYWQDMGKFHYWKIHTDDDIVDYYTSDWIVEGKKKSVIEVWREDTKCISL